MPRFLVMLVFMLFASREGAIHLEGHVYDKDTKRPLEHVQVLLVLGGEDTMIKDRPVNVHNIDVTDTNGYMPSYTDLNGHFLISSMLISCVPKCPDHTFIFTKKGYRSLVIKGAVSFPDSVQLQKAN